MFQDKNARIIKTESWGNYFLLRLAAAEIAQKSKPGQFLMIRVSPGLNPLLRRPLSIHDCSGSEVEIFFQVTGKGTELLSQKKPGDHLDVLGPCGGGFSLLPEFKDKEIFCVGGGRGLAPLYFLARELQTAGARPVVFYGGQTLSDLPLKKRLDEAGACENAEFQVVALQFVPDHMRRSRAHAATGADEVAEAIRILPA